MLERKTVPLVEAKAALDGEGPGTFEGYGSRFNTEPDSYGDVIAPGAYADTIPQFLQNGFISWSHAWDSPVATPITVREDDRGLFLTAQFHTHAAAQQARSITAERLERGKSMGLSIGYETEAYEMRQVETPYRDRWGDLSDKVRVLTRIKLYEIGLVLVGAQPSALVTAAKDAPLPFDAHSDDVRVAVAEWLARVKSGSDIRARENKVGRAISEARRQRMAGVRESLSAAIEEIDGLLEETAPPKSDEPIADTEPLALFLAFQQTRARLAGVTL